MTTVLTLPRDQSLAGLIRSAGAQLEWKPNRAAMIGGGRILTPQPMTVDFAGGDTQTANLTPCDGSEGWCWKVSLLHAGRAVLTRYVLVPDSATPVNIDDLPIVDPDTLQPSDAAAPAWDAAAAGMVAQFEAALTAEGSPLREAAATAVTDEIAGRSIPTIIFYGDAAYPGETLVDSASRAVYRFENAMTDATDAHRDLVTHPALATTASYTADAARFGSYGRAGGAFQIPNTVDEFVVAGQPMPEVSFEAWVRTTASGGTKVVMGRSRAYWLGMDGSGNAQARYNGAASSTVDVILSSTAKINDGTWHHLALIIGPTGGALHVDGARVASSASVGYRSTNLGGVTFNGFELGTLNSSSSFAWSGAIDEVRISSKARVFGYPARPAGLRGGLVTWIGPTAPTGAVKGDAWRKVSA